MNVSNSPPNSNTQRPSRALRGVALALPIAVVALAALPHLPRGICYEDSGDLQVAAAVLGIPHPPGYAGYISLGHLLTRVMPLDPALTLNAVCLACGLAAVGLCTYMQLRLGVTPLVSAAGALCFAIHHEVWSQILVPEVYLPSLLLLIGALLATDRWIEIGGRGRLFCAAVLLGFLIANRPPALLFAPFFAAVFWTTARRMKPARARLLGDAAIALLGLALPIAYTFGYLYCRDVPADPYNYIEGTSQAQPEILPAEDAGPLVKLERVFWQATAAQYRDRITLRIDELLHNWKHAVLRLASYPPIPSAALLGIVLFGAYRLWRRRRECAVLLIGCAVAAFVFTGCYRDPGFPADLLPALLGATVCAGSAITALLHRWRSRYRPGVEALLLAVVCCWIFANARERSFAAYDADASSYVAHVELDRVPVGSVIFSSWRTSPPLWYALLVLHDRPDVEIVNAEPQDWMSLAARYDAGAPPRPVYFAYEPPEPAGRTFVEEAGLFRAAALQPTREGG